ncbi:MAG: hypothetical protein Q8L48_12405 [Archangium sp.]|nr:hypothetical protein [Archangium sp.]
MRALWLGGALLLVSCDASRLNGTALLITAHAGSTPLEQLRYQATDEQGLLTFGPELRPEVPAGRQPSITAVRVLLPDSADGQVLEVLVEGLIGQAVVLDGRALVRVEQGLEAAVTIALAAPAHGCADCAGCCSPAETCLSATASACGVGGAACVGCDRNVADGCAADGTCACGAQGPCGEGTRCSGGTCVCDAASCGGCCTGAGQCLSGTSRSSCGLGGATCGPCERRCTRGACE